MRGNNYQSALADIRAEYIKFGPFDMSLEETESDILEEVKYDINFDTRGMEE